MQAELADAENLLQFNMYGNVLTSDESVKETLIDNDYEFDEEGNIV